MLRLAKAFLNIALWRQSPAELPASVFLLGLVVVVAVLVEVADALFLTPHVGTLLRRVVLSVGIPLAFTWVVLRIGRCPQRFLQTGAALLGVAVLMQLVWSPLGELFNVVGPQEAAALPLGLLLLVLFVWYVLACANIFRAALESNLMLGGAISIAYLLITMALQQQFLTSI